ncbi:MAG: hybrid sensor histidine kinase/response regulator, partial [Cyanobacteria bacterium J06639_1]
RCHSLVMLGRMEKIPASLDRLTPDVPSESQSAPELDAFDMAELADLETAIADLDTNAIAADLDDAISSEHADAIDMAGLEAELQSAIAALEETDVAAELDAIDLDAAMELVGDEDGRDRVAADLDAATLAELDSVALDVGALSELETAIGELDFDSLENELGESDREEIEAFAPAVPKPAPKLTVSPERQAQPSSGQTVRIPVEQLARINTLFGKLILERNAVNLRLGQMHSLVKLQKERMRRLETSNDRLRTWYDRASISGTLPGITSDAASADGLAIDEHSTQIPTPISALSAAAGDFDALEMDRYTDLHLLSQEQMETVVQLQEVSADIELSLQEMSQASRDLTFTTRGLQESITRAQMRPFADLVGRFPRIVRDLSIQHEKQVTLKIEGDLTPIDRNALEVLSDPLMHLVRNAFDHGIEEASSRISAGKSAAGTISLRAAHRGNQLVITISDDGGGINLDKIRDRCRKFGIADAQIEEMSDADLLDLIFEPGFSTADRVTELSGRGVGMDVVRTNLQDIRGTIRVDTNPGRGTTFTIALPLSLSILRVMTVAKGDMIFAVPMDSVKEVLQVPEERVVAEGDREQVSWNGTLVPLTRLESILTFTRPTKTFEMEGTPKVDRPTVLITGSSEQPRSLWLDRIWDEQEVAFRPISSPIALPPGYLGSTVLGDGRVIPLIDPALLIDELGSKGGEAAVSEVLTSDVKSDRDGHTILVVDDSINVRRFLALTLEKNGYSVEQARDGQEAVDKIVGGLDVNAVICDVEMPRLDGYGVLTEIKSDARYRDLPIAMLTSRSNDKHRKVAMNLGASAYFSKPYNERELLETLERLI